MTRSPDAPRAEFARRAADSARTTTSPLTPDPAGWLAAKRAEGFSCEPVPLDEVCAGTGWSVGAGGNLAHQTGRFFSVEGLRGHLVDGDHRTPVAQPVLVQRDVAILGLLVREVEGVLHVLLQGKVEPGNLGMVQLSPTVQATTSNYSRVHRGRRTPFSEFFTDPSCGRTVVDTLQSEQGQWFHLKRNRNVVVEVTGEVPEHPDYCWLTLGQVRELLATPHAVNMDSRTVLAGMPLAEPVGQFRGEDLGGVWAGAQDPAGTHAFGDVESWLTRERSRRDVDVRLVPMDRVPAWQRTPTAISPVPGTDGPFEIVGARTRAHTREVSEWVQPLLRPLATGVAALAVRTVGGRLHALVRAELLPGNRDGVELGPTARGTLDDTGGVRPEHRLAAALLADPAAVRSDVEQSEEGGRFQHARTRYVVTEVDDSFGAGDPALRWVSLPQLLALGRRSYSLGVELRTLVLALLTA